MNTSKKEKIYPITVEGKFLAVTVSAYNIFSMVLWIVLWSAGLVYTYLHHTASNWILWAATLALVFVIALFVYSLSSIKPLFTLDNEGIQITYDKYKGVTLRWGDVSGIELKSRRAAVEGSPSFMNTLLIYTTTTKSSENVIKLPLGLTRYAWFLDERRIRKIKEKLQRYPVKLINFDTDIETQNRNYLMDEGK